MGRRVEKQVGGESTRYVWDFERLLQEADGSSGATEQQYLNVDRLYGDLVSGYGNGSSKYYEFDALGSTETLLDDTGSVMARFEYRAYGLTSSSGGVPGLALPAALPNPLGSGGGASESFAWVGQQGYFRDPEIDLYLLGAGAGGGTNGRYYDPATARFLTPDPIEYDGHDPNLYRYVGNDPINSIDPSGQGAADLVVDLAYTILQKLGFDTAKLRSAIDQCTGINILSYFSDLQGDFWRVLSLLSDPLELINTIGGGTLDALKHVADSWVPIFKEGFDDWLGLPGFTDLTLNPDADKLIPFIAAGLGLTWEDLVEKIRTKTGAEIDTLLSALEEISKSLDGDVGEAINRWRAEWLKEVEELQEEFTRQLTDARDSMVNWLVEEVGKKVLEKLIGKAIKAGLTGGLGALVTTVIDLANTAVNEGTRLCDLLEMVLKGIQGVIRGEGRDKVKERLILGLKKSVPIGIAAVAQQLGVGKAPQLVRKSVEATREKANRPLDKILDVIGPRFEKFNVLRLKQLGLPPEYRPLSREVRKAYPEYGFGEVMLWVTKKDKEAYMRGSPIKKVVDVLDGKVALTDDGSQPGGEMNRCLGKVKANEHKDLVNKTATLTDLAGAKLTKAKAKQVPKLIGDFVMSEGKLLDAIMKCIGTEIDPCDLAGLTMPVSQDPTAGQGLYASSARFTYLPTAAIYNPLNEKFDYKPPLTVLARVQATDDNNKYDAPVHDAWTLYWPCKIHKPYYDAEKNRTSIQRRRTQLGPCERAGANMGMAATSMFAYLEQSGAANCDKCTYYSHPIIGWAGANKPNTDTTPPDTIVNSDYCRLPGPKERDNVGHLIGAAFGGYANLRLPNPNAIPQNGQVNQGDFNTHEKLVRAAARGKRLCIRIMLTYAATTGSKSRPSSLLYYYWINRQQPSAPVGNKWPRDFPNGNA
ncbi:MAG: DNA/RNA non-specific endonuclease [Bacteroidales bacterium]|nr:DNA/RNA non-specific endonuclease [Bacteroidales bacterium]